MAPAFRPWLWGPAAAVLLLVAAGASVALGMLAGIPLFDGLAPPPVYRWVQPPAGLRSINTPPDSVTASEVLPATGTVVVGTPDGQALVSCPAGAFAAPPGQSALRLSIRPLAASAVAPLPPGVVIQGNAYRIQAVYLPSGATATAVQSVDVILRYPVDATQMVGHSGGAWHLLPTIPESQLLSLDATTTQFGVVAAARTGVHPRAPSRIAPWAYVAAGLALAVGAVPLLTRRRPRPPAGPAEAGPAADALPGAEPQ